MRLRGVMYIYCSCFNACYDSAIEIVCCLPACLPTCLPVYRRYDALKQQGLKEERLLLLESWRDAELALEGEGSIGGDSSNIELKMPRKVKMRKMSTADDGSELGWEEYYDYIFPDDEKKVGKLLYYGI